MLLTFYHFSCKHSWCRKTAHFISRYSAYAFFAVYLFAGLYLLHVRSKWIILFICVPLANLIISFLIRAIVKRERPCTALNLQVLYEEKKSYSFPSNHTASSAIIAFACLPVNYYLGVVVFILAVFTSLSRLFLASHYPSDIGFAFVQSAVVAVIGFNIVPAFFL